MELDLKSERRIYEAGIRPSAEIGLALITRLEQAEQAVGRVRAVIKGAPTVDPLRGFAGPPDDWPDDTDFTSYGEWIMANRVRETLDGDTRRLADQGLGDNLARTTKNGDSE